MESLEADNIKAVSPMKLFIVVVDSFTGDKKYLNQSQYNIYSDGSKTAAGVGAGFTILRNGLEILSGEVKLLDGCTFF